MVSHKHFKVLPKNGVLLKDILNWFLLGYKSMYKECKEKNNYYSGVIEIGYCGSDLCELNDNFIEISLIHSGEWGFETFEQASISVPTKFDIELYESFFVKADTPHNLNELIKQIKENLIFSELLSSKIDGHDICFDEHNG